MVSLARLKNSVELGSVGELVKRRRRSSSTYQTSGKVGNIVSNPESAERFLSYPGAKELSENPKILALREDPEITDMIVHGKFLDLLRDERLIEACERPRTRRPGRNRSSSRRRWITRLASHRIALAMPLSHYDRPRSSRAAQDALEDVLRLPGGIWCGSEHAHLPDLSRFARRAAGDESRSAAPNHPDRSHARLRYRADQQVRSKELFLSGHAEELSDLAV